MKKIFLIAFLGILIFGSGLAFAGQGLKLKAFKPAEVFEKLKNWDKEIKVPEMPEIEKGSAPKSLTISASGNVKITDAEVVSVGDETFTVKVWGISLKINTDSETKFLVGKLRDWSFEEIKVGDKVDVLGEISEESGETLARLVNAKVSFPRIQNEEVARLRSIIEGLIRQLQEALRKVGRQLPPEISPLPEVSPSPEATE
jgi:hypothetical protein